MDPALSLPRVSAAVLAVVTADGTFCVSVVVSAVVTADGAFFVSAEVSAVVTVDCVFCVLAVVSASLCALLQVLLRSAVVSDSRGLFHASLPCSSAIITDERSASSDVVSLSVRFRNRRHFPRLQSPYLQRLSPVSGTDELLSVPGFTASSSRDSLLDSVSEAMAATAPLFKCDAIVSTAWFATIRIVRQSAESETHAVNAESCALLIRVLRISRFILRLFLLKMIVSSFAFC